MSFTDCSGNRIVILRKGSSNRQKIEMNFTFLTLRLRFGCVAVYVSAALVNKLFVARSRDLGFFKIVK